MTRVVFLDRDGVICRKPAQGDYIKRWEEFHFLPRAKEALALLTTHGYQVIVVTNQRGIALGLMTEEDLASIHRRMCEELALAGARLAAVYYCPHELGTCSCRKPETGMFERARADFPDLDFAAAYMVGDSWMDIEAGRRLGLRTILISPGSDDRAGGGDVYSQEESLWVVSSLHSAVAAILALDGSGPGLPGRRAVPKEEGA